MKFSTISLALLPTLAYAAPLGTRQAQPDCNSAQEMRTIATSRYWTLSYLALANYAYTNQSKTEIQDVTTMLPKYISEMASPSCGPGLGSVPGGKWSTVWGPAFTHDNSNLMYMAELRNGANEPILISLVIRGTDGAAKYSALYKQVFQDLGANERATWNSVAMTDDLSGPDVCKYTLKSNVPTIAMGTCHGMQQLMTLKSAAGQTALQFLKAYYQVNPTVPQVVTGHSLGGTQTEAIALYIKLRNPMAIVSAVPFAPASAGNPPFAELWRSELASTSALWANKYDIVPYAFENVAGIKKLYGSVGGPPMPIDILGLVDAFQITMIGSKYQQPGEQFWLDSSIVQRTGGKNTWVNQVGTQHMPPQYYKLICQQYVLGGPRNVADFPFVGLSKTNNFVWPGCSTVGPVPDPDEE